MAQTVAEKILIIAPSWLGDCIISQSLLMQLKRRFQNCTIDVVAREKVRTIYTHMPEVHKTYILPNTHGKVNLRQTWRLAKSLRKQYTRAYVLPNSWKSALIPYIAKIRHRHGWLGEIRYVLLNHHRKLNKERYPLMVQRFVALAYEHEDDFNPEAYSLPHLKANPTHQTQLLKQFKLSTKKPVLALCPGAAYGPAKRWPASYFADLAKEKLKAGWSIWLLGAPGDEPACDQINESLQGQAENLAGKTNLSQLIDLLAVAKASVCNDSGAMHVAAAVGAPLVAIFGSSSPGFTPPLSDHVKVLSLTMDCKPCFQRTCPLGHLNCLRQILPQDVLKALDGLIK